MAIAHRNAQVGGRALIEHGARLAAIAGLLTLAGCQPKPEVTWTRHSSRSEKFTVLMPSKPVSRRYPADPVAKTSERIALISNHGDASYRVDFTDFGKPRTGEWATRSLDSARDYLLTGKGWTLREERRITLDGFPGRRLTFDVFNPEDRIPFIASTRLFMVRGDFYQITVVVPKAQSDSPDVDRFLGSFQLIQH